MAPVQQPLEFILTVHRKDGHDGHAVWGRLMLTSKVEVGSDMARTEAGWLVQTMLAELMAGVRRSEATTAPPETYQSRFTKAGHVRTDRDACDRCGLTGQAFEHGHQSGIAYPCPMDLS